MCVYTSYIHDNIMILLIMAFKCLVKILKHMWIVRGYKRTTYVSFRGQQKGNYISGRKLYTSRKLTWVGTLLPVSILFLIKWEHKHVYCEKWTEWLYYTSQHTNTLYTHTQTHIYTHLLGNSYWNSCGIFRFRYVKLQVEIS